jgi:hypothetical protein
LRRQPLPEHEYEGAGRAAGGLRLREHRRPRVREPLPRLLDRPQPRPAADLPCTPTFPATTPTFPAVATWVDPLAVARPTSPALGTIDTSFPKGQAFKDWLGNVGALQQDGRIRIVEPGQLVSATQPVAQSWISLPNDNASNQNTIQYMTFNTPVGADAGAQCGRVVYNNLHVSSGDQPGQPFPNGCVQPDLSDQEKALEFLLFDLSACVQDDRTAPSVPK